MAETLQMEDEVFHPSPGHGLGQTSETAEQTPEVSPEPQDDSPASRQRKDANRRAAEKSRAKKASQVDALRVTMRALEEDNEALRKEIRILLLASGGALPNSSGAQEHESQGRHEQTEDEYNLPSHSFNHGHPFGGHGGEGEGVEGLLGLGSGLGDLANVAAAADHSSGYPHYATPAQTITVPHNALKEAISVKKRKPLASPSDLAAASLRKSIQSCRTVLQTIKDTQPEQDVREQIEHVKAATAQKDKELAVLHGVLRRMLVARQQTQSELAELRQDLASVISELAAADNGPLRVDKENEEVRRALREVRTYVETLVKGWKENRTVPPAPNLLIPLLPPLPALTGNPTMSHVHLGHLPLPSSLPKRRGRPPKARSRPPLLPDSLRHLVPLPDEVRAREELTPMPKRKKLRDDQMRGRPREFGDPPSQDQPEASPGAIDNLMGDQEQRPDERDRQTLELLEGLAQSRDGEPAQITSSQPLTLEQVAHAFGHPQALNDISLDDLHTEFSDRGRKRPAETSNEDEDRGSRARHE